MGEYSHDTSSGDPSSDRGVLPPPRRAQAPPVTAGASLRTAYCGLHCNHENQSFSLPLNLRLMETGNGKQRVRIDLRQLRVLLTCLLIGNQERKFRMKAKWRSFQQAIYTRLWWIVIALVGAPVVALAQTDEIQVYDAAIAEKGKFNLMLHNNFTPKATIHQRFRFAYLDPTGTVPMLYLKVFRDLLGNLGLFEICKLHIPKTLCLSRFESMPGSHKFRTLIPILLTASRCFETTLVSPTFGMCCSIRHSPRNERRPPSNRLLAVRRLLRPQVRLAWGTRMDSNSLSPQPV
jgi:hypothetical protein